MIMFILTSSSNATNINPAIKLVSPKRTFSESICFVALSMGVFIISVHCAEHVAAKYKNTGFPVLLSLNISSKFDYKIKNVIIIIIIIIIVLIFFYFTLF